MEALPAKSTMHEQLVGSERPIRTLKTLLDKAQLATKKLTCESSKTEANF